MSSSSRNIPSTVTEIHSELDNLTIKLLELSQELIHTKLKMERLMKDGFLLMAKARYSEGVKSVSALQIPFGDNAEFEANFKVSVRECLRQEDQVRFKYFSMSSNELESNADGETTLVHRKGQVETGEAKGKPDVPSKKHDPLKWFGVLVPQTLRQSSESFGQSLEVSVEAANLQSEISGVEARRKFLLRILQKKEKGEENGGTEEQS